MRSRKKRHSPSGTPAADSPEGIPPEAPPVEPRSAGPRGFRLVLLWILTAGLVPAALLFSVEGVLRIGGYGEDRRYLRAVEHDRARVYIENRPFNDLFFPAELTRASAAVDVVMSKPEGVCRVFVFGESAAMGEPSPDFAFPRYLQVMLERQFPGARFEVINTAVAAINSHVARAIALACARLEPDLFVVYLGNNEVVGPFGAGTAFQRFSPSLSMIRAGLWSRGTRTGQLMERALGGLRPRGEFTFVNWQGEDIFLEQQVRASDPRLRPVYDHFRSNLEDICDAGLNAGAGVVLCTVSSNLRNCGPFASMHGDLSDAERAAWEGHFEQGMAAQEAKDFPQALAAYERARTIDSAHAELHFRIAQCLEAGGNAERAYEHYTMARDLDTVRLRADTSINRTIRTVAEARASRGLRLVDVEHAFRKVSRMGLPGEELFYEHVHMTLTGYYYLARVIYPEVVARLPAHVAGTGARAPEILQQEEASEILGLNPIDVAAHLDSITSIMSRGIFARRVGHAETMAQIAARRNALGETLTPEVRREAVEMLRGAVGARPEDAALRQRFAERLAMIGDAPGAVRELQALAARFPYRGEYPGLLARVLLGAGSVDEALQHARRAMALPSQHPPYDLLARILEAKGQKEEALELYRTAMLRKPVDAARLLADYARLQQDLGGVEAARKAWTDLVVQRPDDENAVASLDQLLSAHFPGGPRIEAWRELAERFPSAPLPHFRLGRALEEARRTEEAVAAYRSALALRPALVFAGSAQVLGNMPEAAVPEALRNYGRRLAVGPEQLISHLNVAFALSSLGDVSGAVAAYRGAIGCDPGFATAYEELDRLLAVHATAQARAEEWELLSAIHAGHAEPHFRRGLALEAAGQIPQARDAYQRALSLKEDHTGARARIDALADTAAGRGE